jgi:hypothetical protein
MQQGGLKSHQALKLRFEAVAHTSFLGTEMHALLPTWKLQEARPHLLVKLRKYISDQSWE